MQTAKYLSKLLSPLATSEYTIKNTNKLIKRLKEENIPRNYIMVSFDVKSLFTNVPLKKAIDVILRKVYDEKLIKTDITKDEMETLLLLCTKEVHFSFKDEIYVQSDGVAMGSPLGPLLANIYMSELETTIVPKLKAYMSNWKRYIDDTLAYVKEHKIEEIIKTLNSFDKQIQFTFEKEESRQISFLDVLIIRQGNSIQTTVYRKPTHTDLYINWTSFTPIEWKISTLRGIIKRAISVCSNNELLQAELKHIKTVFKEINQYPTHTIERIILEEKTKSQSPEINNENQTNTNKEEKTIQCVLPYAGDKGVTLIKKMKKKNKLPEKVRPRI